MLPQPTPLEAPDLLYDALFKSANPLANKEEERNLEGKRMEAFCDLILTLYEEWSGQ